MVHAHNPYIWEAKQRILVRGQVWAMKKEPVSNKTKKTKTKIL